jgi:codanin-1
MDISIDLERVDTFDLLIRKLIDNDLDAVHFARHLLPFPDATAIDSSRRPSPALRPLLEQFDSFENRRQFIFYFLFKLHSACSWIVFGLNANGSQSCSPVKPLSNAPVATSGLDVKKNLFARYDSSTQPKSTLDFSDQDAFPCLQSTPKTTTRSDDASSKKQRLSWNDTTSHSPIIDRPGASTSVARPTLDSKRNRRIKPTLLRSELSAQGTFGKDGGPNRQLFEQAPLIKANEHTVRADRQRLTNDLRNMTPVDSSRMEALDKIITPLKNLELAPCLVSTERVTFAQLDNLVLFYTTLVTRNCSISLLSEFEFLVHLLSRRVHSDSYEQDTTFAFACNYHNCVLFAALAVRQLIGLRQLDHAGLAFFKTLSMNENVQILLPDFHQSLLQRVRDSEEPTDSTILMPPPDFVAFQPETDSKDNFPHDQSFHAFRKQRDAFFKLYYEWKRLYEKNGFRSDTIHTNVEFKFASKIHHVFSFSKEFGNLYHFSRLFIAHMSQCCIGWAELTGKSAIEKPVAVVDTSILSDSRLKKLNQRFNFQDQKAMATQSSFVGEEQFFLQFVLTSNNYCFLTVLRTLLAEKIEELNNPALLIETLELDQNDSEASALFANCSLHLQLIGKFLGVLLFVPFYSKAIRSANFIKKLESLKSRSQSDVSFASNLNGFIGASIKFGNMILTIPWILQLLSQMEQSSHFFCNYESTLDSLVSIYHQLGRSDLDYPINSTNRFYLTLALGNFFERCSVLLTGRLLRPDLIQTNVLRGKYSRDGLDERCRVNVRFLNESFPRLVALKDSLRVGLQINSDCRKITPLSLSNQLQTSTVDVTLNALNSSADNLEQRFQLEFEENFFRLHSQSLRKTVDFIAERLHSKCIKQMKHEFIKTTKREVIASHSDLSLSSRILHQINDKCLGYIQEFVTDHVPQLFQLLISQVDYDVTVQNIAEKICTRITLEKCHQWIKHNLNDHWMLNELLVENARRTADQEGQTGKASKPGTSLTAPSAQIKPIPNIAPSFNRVRDLICNLYFESERQIEEAEITETIAQLRAVRIEDVLPPKTVVCIDTTILDLLLAVVVNRPALLTDSVLNTFTSYWSEQKLIVQKLISPRNLYTLSISRDSYASWNKFESIITRLIRCLAYPPSSIESDILWSLSNKQDWSEKVLLKLGSILKSVADSCKSAAEYQDSSEIVDLIDWFSWFCAQQNSD